MAQCTEDLAIRDLYRSLAEVNIQLSNLRGTVGDVLQEEYYEAIFLKFDQLRQSLDNLIESHNIIFNNLEQERLSNQIEIIGLPEDYAKDIDGLLFILCKLLHIFLFSTHIKSFQRIEVFKTVGSELEAVCPRPLIIELVDNNIKKRILTVADYKMLHLPGSDIPLYIQERLTDRNQHLLKLARDQALQHHVTHVWVEDGKILVRRRENAPTYEIRCESDIKRMPLY